MKKTIFRLVEAGVVGAALVVLCVRFTESDAYREYRRTGGRNGFWSWFAKEKCGVALPGVEDKDETFAAAEKKAKAKAAAEKMNEQAQNALLKTLEEPPEYGIIILLTNNRDAFLQTILSRAVTLAFLPVADSELVPYLMREAQIPDYRARLAAAFAGGSPGKALACADSEEFQKRRDTAVGLMQNLPDMSDERMAVSAKSLAAKKEELEDILGLMQVWLRDLLYAKAAGRKASLMFSQESDVLMAQAERISYEGIVGLQQELTELLAKRKANVTPEPAIWLMLLHMKDCFR